MRKKLAKRILEWVYGVNENLIRRLNRNLDFNTTLLHLETYEYEKFGRGSKVELDKRINFIIKTEIALQKGIELRLYVEELLNKSELVK